MKYTVFEHCVSIEGNITKSYGIIVTFDNSSTLKYYDVSLDRERVEKLVNDMNEYEIEPVHIKDILEDFYCDNC